MNSYILFYSILLNIFIMFTSGSPVKKNYQDYMKEPAVQRFMEYLKIDTSEGKNIKSAVEFWKRQASELNLPISIVTPNEGEPVVVITVEGSDPSLPSIMLNSHSDVVGVDESEWLYPPFAAHMDEFGDIYARGAQDTKDVGIQYMEAMRNLKRDNITFLRNIYITVMPDEERGGHKGMRLFVNTEKFQSMNVGFAFDEGLASKDNNTMFATYVDRRPWQMQFIVHGEGGHGSQMPNETAMSKAYNLIKAVMSYREMEKKIMTAARELDFGAYSSVNINMAQGGYAPNVIPTKMLVVVDMRLSTQANVSVVQNMVNQWMREAGNDTELKFIRRVEVSSKTRLDDSNPYWVNIESTVKNMGYNIVPIVCSATSDMLVLRNRGIPAIGFTTKTNTISRIHAKNEYLNVETFMKGIDVYYEVIKNVANLPKISDGHKNKC